MTRFSEVAGALDASRHNALGSASGQQGDVVICYAKRTAIGKAYKGSFRDTLPEDLLSPLFADMLRTTGCPGDAIGDVCLGNVLMPGAGPVAARCGSLMGGLPAEVPVYTVDRQCSSGLQAIANIVAAIRTGVIDIGVGGGVESMSQFDMTTTLVPEKISDTIFDHPIARDCLLPMGITSENVAEDYGITREQLDSFSVTSQHKAHMAREEGRFKKEIVPVRARTLDEKGTESWTIVESDEGIRPGVNKESLGKLKPAFKTTGSTTAGNSSQMSDGAAICLLARREAAERLRLPILAVWIDFTVVGVPPRVMGIGPALAIPKLLSRNGITIESIDTFELNEAFASQASYCQKKIGIPDSKINPCGGAIALGHPLGATGARCIATILHHLERSSGKRGIVSMCVGTGMGAAALIEMA